MPSDFRVRVLTQKAAQRLHDSLGSKVRYYSFAGGGQMLQGFLHQPRVGYLPEFVVTTRQASRFLQRVK